MAFGHLGKGVRYTGTHRALQVSGLVAKLLQAGLGGEVGHQDSFRAAAVRVASRKEEYLPLTSGCPAQVDSVLPADRGCPANLHSILACEERRTFGIDC
jgi:hypothetical protein